MERILTFCKKMIDETGQEHLLYYWLLRKQKKGTEDTIYGIEIAKYREGTNREFIYIRKSCCGIDTKNGTRKCNTYDIASPRR